MFSNIKTNKIFRAKLIPILFFISSLTYGQQLTEVTTLSDLIIETSGLIYLNQKLITHNDSGGEPALFEIDSVTGDINRKVVVDNAVNVDWEDICNDETYIYIGDFGNNLGTRTDLKIYRLLISDYFSSDNLDLNAETINFNYADQIDFTPSPYSTNFDAEAIISYGDSLYIFTKNWIDFKTNIYALPKTTGTYQATKTDDFDSGGLITGATYNVETNTILLTGYTSAAFIIEIFQIETNKFSDGIIDKYYIQTEGSFQVEGIAPINNSQYYLTTEGNLSEDSELYRLTSKNYMSAVETIEQKINVLYPNPASGEFNIRCDNLSFVEFYDIHGILRKTSNMEKTDVTELRPGLYFVFIKKIGADKPEIQKLIVK